MAEQVNLQDLQDELQLLCEQHHAASAIVRETLEAAAAELTYDFQQRIKNCALDQHALSQKQPLAMDTGRKQSQWSQQETSLLLQLGKQFKADQATASKQSMYLQIQTLLPGKTIAAISEQHRRCTEKQALDSRSNGLCDAWCKASKAFLEDAKMQLVQSAKQQAAAAQAAADKVKCLSVQQELHSKLQVMRFNKYVQDEFDAMQSDAAAKALAEQQAEDCRQHQCRMQYDKQQLALYWEAQEYARAEAQATAAVQAKADAEQAKFQAQKNVERVVYRQAEGIEKERLKAERIVQQENEERQRQERLDKLRAQVVPHVDADPDRILAATAASSAQQQADTAAFAPVHGYTTETLLKDKRFKVLEALRQQSLHSTGYAKQALLAIPPLAAPRRDTLLTVAKT